MVEVFRTNVPGASAAVAIENELSMRFPELLVNFDLEDCDRILRVENCSIDAKDVIQIVNEKGFFCETLE